MAENWVTFIPYQDKITGGEWTWDRDFVLASPTKFKVFFQGSVNGGASMSFSVLLNGSSVYTEYLSKQSDNNSQFETPILTSTLSNTSLKLRIIKSGTYGSAGSYANMDANYIPQGALPYHNINGVWKKPDGGWSNENGIWRDMSSSYCNENGVWRTV